MLAPHEKMALIRHLLAGSSGLSDRLIPPGGQGLSADGKAWCFGPEATASEKLLCQFALDLWEGTEDTFLGKMCLHLSGEQKERLADVMRAIALDRLLDMEEWLSLPPGSWEEEEA